MANKLIPADKAIREIAQEYCKLLKLAIKAADAEGKQIVMEYDKETGEPKFRARKK